MDDAKKMFREDAEDDGYKRYKQLAYCKLVIKAFLFFFLGVLICHLLGG
nr:MAG TPA: PHOTOSYNTHETIC REACTION CENTER, BACTERIOCHLOROPHYLL B REACTION CENTER, SECONDARY QUINONE [Caudoviricetes sp.]